MSVRKLLPDDDGRVTTRLDGFIIQRESVDDDAPIVVPPAIADVIGSNLTLGDGHSVADVFARMWRRHLAVLGRV
jgi:hypothetical protein